jgi:ABC-type transport system substrate-binding protein
MLKLAFMVLAIVVLLLSACPVNSTIEPPFDQPRFDEIWYKVILDPSEAVMEMMAGTIDYLPAAPTYQHYIDLRDTYGFNTSLCEMAKFAFFGFNCRDYAPPEASIPGITLEPCNDSIFRTAMHYAIGNAEKARITAAILGPLTYPLDSIVPPAQAEWHNPAVFVPQLWAFANLNLFNAGYTVTDGRLYNPDGTVVRTIDLLYPSGDSLLQVTIQEYCIVWNQFFEWIGVTEAGGGGYLQYPIRPVPMSFGAIVYKMLYTHDFDMVAMEWTNLGRFPDWLYDLFHSSFAVQGAYNFVGFVDNACDALLETIKFDLNRTKVRDACMEFQEHFSYEWNPYIVISSGYQASAYGRRNPSTGDIRQLGNYVAMPSYCSDNDWTWDLMHWEDTPSGDYVNRRIAQPPSELHPWYADEPCEWNILDRLISGLLNIVPIGPDTLKDMPWIACNWAVTYWQWPALGITNGMKLTFNLRHDVYWQNGDQVTAEDVMMNWDMLREWKPGRYSTMWQNLIYTEVESPFTVAAYINQTSITSLYDFADTALFFPKRILQEYEARLHDVSDPWYHDPQAFTPWTQDYTSFFTHTKIPVDPDPVDPSFSNIYEGDDISGNIGHDPSGDYAEPAKMTEEYKCLIGCGEYIFDYWHDADNIGHMVAFPKFWWDSPVEQNFIAPTRVDPGQTFEYYEEVQNLGAKAGGEFTPVTISYINLTVDGAVVGQIEGPIVIQPFQTVVIGASGIVTYEEYQHGTKPAPFNYTFPTKGLHYLDCIIVVDDPIVLTDSFYKHYIWVTFKEDINLDFQVDFKDLLSVSKAFESYPGHPRWDSRADINDNFRVDMQDLNLVYYRYTGTYENIAITNVTVSKTIVCQGYSVKINVTLTNDGASSQNFDLTICLGSIDVKTSPISLGAGSSITKTFDVIPHSFLFEEISREPDGVSTGNVGGLSIIGEGTTLNAMTGTIAFGSLPLPGGIIELRYLNGTLIRHIELLIYPDDTNTVFTAGNYSNGLYVIGTTDGKLYFLDNKGEVGELTVGIMPVNDIQIEGLNVTVSTRNQVILLRRCSADFTLSKGNYTIKAVADIVSGEMDAADNTFIDGWVFVAMVGDVDANGKVDMIDLWEEARHFGIDYPDPRYKPNFDIDDNLKIDMLDLWITAKEFGKIDP